MKKLLAVLIFGLFCCAHAGAQGFTYENFSGFPSGHTLAGCGSPTSGSDCATLVNSWFGTGTNMSQSTIQNSTGALTIQTTSACPTAPPNHSGNYLDYSTTIGSGVSDQILYLYYPTSGVSALSMGSFWFCSTVPVTASFGTTWDAFTVISGGGSRLSNYTSNGTSQCWDIEGNSSQACIPYTPNNWVQVVWQFIAGGTCSSGNFPGCVRLQLYDVNGNFIGQQYESVPAGAPVYQTFGDINGPTLPSGFHVQFADIKTCTIGCSATQFPELQNPVPPWDGVLTSGLGVDWSQAGFNGGVPPDAAWTQCGSTLSPGTITGAAITSTLAGCPANTYYLLGSGSFSGTGQIKFPTSGNVVLRGSGSNSTTLNWSGGGTGCEQAQAVICAVSADSTDTQSPGTPVSWIAGYQQGTNQITVSSIPAGIVLNSTMLMLDQCDTGLSTGAGCTSGINADNGNFYVCGKQYIATGSGAGCSADGPDSGGLRPNRGQMQIVTATNISGNVITISPPLIFPNWNSGQTPQVWIVQPVKNFGIENLTLNASSSSVQIGIEFGSAYHWWISGVRIESPTTWGSNCFQCANGNYVNSYVYGLSHTNNPYGIRMSFSGNNLLQNNILQQDTTPFSFDGASSGNVVAYNLCLDALFSSATNVLQSCFNKHAQNYFDLIEGNVGQQDNNDGIHGTGSGQVRDRNLFQGWESFPSTPKTAFTNSINDASFDRYETEVGNLMGTVLYHSGSGAGYQSTSCPNNNQAIYVLGTNCPAAISIPADFKTASTTLRFGNYDVFTAATRFCGNLLDTRWGTTCTSTSEVPTGASTYPQFVPFKGDTAIGEPPLPASLYLSGRPGWWNPTIPFPAIGPEITGGNLGICSGALNVVGQFDGEAALNNTQCGGHGFTAAAWGGHANAIPAMVAYFSAGGTPDGSGAVLPIDLSYSSPGVVTLTPSTLSFGTITQNTTSAGMNITVTNASGSTISILTDLIPASTYSPDFTISSRTCGSTLANGLSCTFTITTTPTATPGTLETATLQVTFSGASGSPVSSTLAVTSGSPGTVTLTPSSLSFGLVPQNASSAGQTVTLTNSSGSLISAVTPSYTANWSTLSTTCGATLATGLSCTFIVEFTPTSTPGTIESGTMQVAYTGATGSPVSSVLSGTSGNPFVVQQHASTNAPTLAFNPNVTAGHIGIAFITDYSKIATVSITDTAGNSWALIQSENLATDGDTSAILCAPLLTSGPDTLTFLANGVSGDNFVVNIFEVSGHTCTTDVASVVDNHTGATACGNGTLSITTVTVSDFLVQGCAVAGGGGARVFTPGTGWANQLPNNGVGNASYAFGSVQTAASPGTFNAGGTFSPATEEATIVVAFMTTTPPVIPPPPAPCPTCFAGSGTWNGTTTKTVPISASIGGGASVPIGNATVTVNISCVCTVPKGSSTLSCTCTGN